MGKKKHKKGDIAEMLMPLATLDEINVSVPTAKETETGIVPDWCELRLTMKRMAGDDIGGDFPIHVDVPIRRHDGELLIQVLWDVLHPSAPTSSAEQLWDGLDDVVERIQARVVKGKDPKPDDVAIARTLTTALAIIDRPLDPDPDAVREAAMTRWTIRHN